MRINCDVELLEFESKAYTKAINDAIALHVKKAALAFVRAALSRIPVDTGMAAGSFLHLGRYFKRIGMNDPQVEEKINAERKSPTGKYYHRPGKAGEPIPKDEFTPGKYGLVDRPASLAFSKSENKHSFIFHTEVFHFTLLDTEFTNPGGPWRAIEHGRDAFIFEMKFLRPHLPDVKAYMTKTKITLGKTGLKRATQKPLVQIRRQAKVT